VDNFFAYITTDAAPWHAVQPKAPKAGTGAAKDTAALTVAREALAALEGNAKAKPDAVAAAREKVTEAAKRALSGVKFLREGDAGYRRVAMDADTLSAYVVANAEERAAILATLGDLPEPSESPVHPSVLKFDGARAWARAMAEQAGVTEREFTTALWADGLLVLPSTGTRKEKEGRKSLAERTAETVDALFGAE